MNEYIVIKSIIDELALKIRQVFIKWFEIFLSIEKCYPVALKIWEATKKHRALFH